MLSFLWFFGTHALRSLRILPSYCVFMDDGTDVFFWSYEQAQKHADEQLAFLWVSGSAAHVARANWFFREDGVLYNSHDAIAKVTRS